jgi:deazaflavin-dependent oxidoreductase (nitroreductase family)
MQTGSRPFHGDHPKEPTVTDPIRAALETDRVIDITTTGRTTGEPRRVEIWFHRIDDRFFITGMPGRRDWYANLLAQPDFTFHLKGSAQADLPASARIVDDAVERNAILSILLDRLGHADKLDRWMVASPLIEVEFDAGTLRPSETS